MPGFWKRPTTRMYSYNLDLGEHYYYPMTNYLESERGTRGETPGAMTFGERLSRRWVSGKRYGSVERSGYGYRSSSIGRGEGITSAYLDSDRSARAAMARARSEVREWREATPPFDPQIDPNNVTAFARYKQSLLDSSRELRASSMARQNAIQSRQSSEVAQQRAAASVMRSTVQRQSRAEAAAVKQEEIKALAAQREHIVQNRRSGFRARDDITKRIADVHMQPWSAGQEYDEAQSATQRARARIGELERELDVITRKALTTQSAAMKTASQLAKEAMMEDAQMAQSTKKSRKVMIQSSAKVAR